MTTTISTGGRDAEVRRPAVPDKTLPLPFRMTQAAFAGLGSVMPSTMAKLAWRLFFTPRRHPTPAREQEVLERAELSRVSWLHGSLAVYRWGEPIFPWEVVRGTALVVHGWEGRATQMFSFVDPLLQHGWRVVGMDCPAHGRSDGERTDLLQVRDSILAVQDAVGPVDVVVAHSMGAAAAVLALARGLHAERMILISVPSQSLQVLHRFCNLLNLPIEAASELKRMMEASFGRDMWKQCALDHLAARLPQQALIVHDVEDTDVPHAESVHLAKAWKGSHLLSTTGLGHRRILRDPHVVQEVVRFAVDGQGDH